MTLTRRAAVIAGGAAMVGCSAPAADRDTQSLLGHHVDGTARLGFLGDLLLARGVERRHRSTPAAVWDGIDSRLRALNGVLGNLECSLTARGEPWPEKTWCFRGTPEWATSVLEAGNVSAVSLANNHTMDYGPVSVADTTTALDATGVAHAGAGSDRAAAFAPTTFTAGDLTVAMVSYTDRFQPFAAGPERPGTAYLDMDVYDVDLQRRVESALSGLPESVDLVVASLHWGPNYEEKTDRHCEFGRWLIDRGVDVVHGHSAHEVAGIEIYDGRPILYDTGNFVADFAPVEGHRNDLSFLYELVVEDGLSELRLHPVEIAAESVRPAGPRSRQWLRERVESRSARFGTEMQASSAEEPLTISI
jgi:poly-gamma-glutamate synthesis protein (capsule biosynthesis protein)